MIANPRPNTPGSSPRGRGTREALGWEPVAARFIPAGAGNAGARWARIARLTVHPRGGGERPPRRAQRRQARGSSPRGRGTQDAVFESRAEARFIPAGAGNASGLPTTPGCPSVHPRGGGERCVGRTGRVRPLGSSPRGRGTRPFSCSLGAVSRFIPAGAGNASIAELSASRAAVHPRGGGERRRRPWMIFATIGSSPRGRAVHPRGGGERGLSQPRTCTSRGSSPRGRGTHVAAPMGKHPPRFIPAGAGNATFRASCTAESAVHPRGGGERTPLPCALVWLDGSSPRGRGTQCLSSATAAKLRFIPAGAGNASRRRPARRPAAVHPRGGGERWAICSIMSAMVGSSPRGRGTLGRQSAAMRRGRFIPAGAGNAQSWPEAHGEQPVHPRGGGERRALLRLFFHLCGSSPRGRGTLRFMQYTDAALRFIPAGAGNASEFGAVIAQSPVHPRGGGERQCSCLAPYAECGSSPRGRGTLAPVADLAALGRFIPAGAGNAAFASASAPLCPVHPRGGGERCPAALCCPSLLGSSPRGRGTRNLSSNAHSSSRFIPAGAGNAT